FVHAPPSSSPQSRVRVEKLVVSPRQDHRGRLARRLLRQLHRLPTAAERGVEVWCLWDAEPFYKDLGYADVYAPSDGGAAAAADNTAAQGRRVVADFGPLLLWSCTSSLPPPSPSPSPSPALQSHRLRTPPPPSLPAIATKAQEDPHAADAVVATTPFRSLASVTPAANGEDDVHLNVCVDAISSSAGKETDGWAAAGINDDN
ncbi:hypothetical protein HK405_002733, partial [Cladochytrium tenue]